MRRIIPVLFLIVACSEDQPADGPPLIHFVGFDRAVLSSPSQPSATLTVMVESWSGVSVVALDQETGLAYGADQAEAVVVDGNGVALADIEIPWSEFDALRPVTEGETRRVLVRVVSSGGETEQSVDIQLKCDASATMCDGVCTMINTEVRCGRCDVGCEVGEVCRPTYEGGFACSEY
jgi:hypothetical protein